MQDQIPVIMPNVYLGASILSFLLGFVNMPNHVFFI